MKTRKSELVAKKSHREEVAAAVPQTVDNLLKALKFDLAKAKVIQLEGGKVLVACTTVRALSRLAPQDTDGNQLNPKMGTVEALRERLLTFEGLTHPNIKWHLNTKLGVVRVTVSWRQPPGQVWDTDLTTESIARAATPGRRTALNLQAAGDTGGSTGRHASLDFYDRQGGKR
jgi:hypothetical protein